ncbi:MAG: hypothetical protein M3256_17860 [Actinomycetota bacterium]|nr:hypothetical protein [Actinomycetota bacterium]
MVAGVTRRRVLLVAGVVVAVSVGAAIGLYLEEAVRYLDGPPDESDWIPGSVWP